MLARVVYDSPLGLPLKSIPVLSDPPLTLCLCTRDSLFVCRRRARQSLLGRRPSRPPEKYWMTLLPPRGASCPSSRWWVVVIVTVGSGCGGDVSA